MDMKQHIKDFGLITLGTLIVTIGVYFFKFPNNFCTGGVSGISVILGAVSPFLSAGGFVLLINTVLLLAGFIFIGRDFGLKTVYCSTLMSVGIYALESFFPLTAPLTTQPILELLFAILFSALGAAVLFFSDASTGGTDIIAMIIKKYASINISKALFLADFIIVMLTAFVFGIETWLFSLIGFASKLLFVNSTLESMNLSKYCTVITSPDYEDQICNFITHTLKKTATVSNSYSGAYNGDRKSVLLVALTRKQAIHLKKFVKELDEKSFIIINNTSEISGRGFHEMV